MKEKENKTRENICMLLIPFSHLKIIYICITFRKQTKTLKAKNGRDKVWNKKIQVIDEQESKA